MVSSKRRDLEQRDMEERKRKREKEIEEEEKAKVDKEWQKNYEESREGRVSSWQKFQAKKKPKSQGSFKPPKHKMEQRWKFHVVSREQSFQYVSTFFQYVLAPLFHFMISLWPASVLTIGIIKSCQWDQ